jgi:hypothetical protein
MDGLRKQEKISMLGAVAMAAISRQFSGECYGTLDGGTARDTISLVVQTFRGEGRQNPTKGSDHELASFYQDSSSLLK